MRVVIHRVEDVFQPSDGLIESSVLVQAFVDQVRNMKKQLLIVDRVRAMLEIYCLGWKRPHHMVGWLVLMHKVIWVRRAKALVVFGEEPADPQPRNGLHEITHKGMIESFKLQMRRSRRMGIVVGRMVIPRGAAGRSMPGVVHAHVSQRLLHGNQDVRRIGLPGAMRSAASCLCVAGGCAMCRMRCS